MIALAFGPGSEVLIWGASMAGSRRRLFPLPPRDRTAVLEGDAAAVEIRANAIRFSEIARQPRGPARGDQLLDLGHRHGRPLVLCGPKREDTEHLVELGERFADRR